MAARISLLKFTGTTAGIVIAISLVWPFVAPSYNRLLIGTADHIIPSGVNLKLADMNNTIMISYEQHLSGLKRDLTTWIPGYALHFGLILVTALIAASPGVNLTSRFKFVVTAYFTLFIIHIVTILTIAKVLASYGYGAFHLFDNPLQILFITIGCDLFPVMIWGTIYFKYLRRDWVFSLPLPGK